MGNKVIGGRERAKHINIHKNFAHEATQNGHLKLLAVSTSDQLANIFTKELPPGSSNACSLSLQDHAFSMAYFKVVTDVDPHEGGMTFD